MLTLKSGQRLRSNLITNLWPTFSGKGRLQTFHHTNRHELPQGSSDYSFHHVKLFRKQLASEALASTTTIRAAPCNGFQYESRLRSTISQLL
ncbi:hypothetical protein METHPM2_30017 [Pseudomonas sp. PM2]